MQWLFARSDIAGFHCRRDAALTFVALRYAHCHAAIENRMPSRATVFSRSTRLRWLLASVLLLSACSTITRIVHDEPASTTTTAPTPEQGRYEALIGQSADAITELRAAPAPENPEMRDGKSAASDEQLLGGQGYLRIGNGFYPSATPEMRGIALHQGQRVGADKILLYVSSASAMADAARTLTAAYYVHFKPPFGASFRDLNAPEQQALGVSGGVNLGAIIGGTPAASANLLAGDAVLTLDGKPIANKATFQDLLRANAGKRVTLGISRDGVLITRIVRIGLLPLSSTHKH